MNTKVIIYRLRVAILLAAVFVSSGAAAAKDTCWDFKGALVRLKSSGETRTFLYEILTEENRREGVMEGFALLRARQIDKRIIGNALEYRDQCSRPLDEFHVDGFANANNRIIVLEGKSQVHNQCNPTSILENRKLVLTYVRDC